MNRLVSIDCLRGMAALAVVFHHVFLTHASPHTTFEPLDVIEQVMALGFSGVWLFIVLSGFCIHLRVAKNEAAGLPRQLDFFRFWRRRIVRLYPAYLLALTSYIAIRLAEGSLRITPFFFYDVGMHLLMLHNLDGRTLHSFCGVFWSLALEEQLYLAYFLLLYLRRRLGWKWTLALCFATRVIAYGVHAIVHQTTGFVLPTQACVASQWFVWALGALSVEAYVGLVRLPSWCKDFRVAAGILLFTSWLIFFDGWYPHSLLSKPIWFFMDLLLGLGFFILVNACVSADTSVVRQVRGRPFLRVVALTGVISYSLYLTHQMVLLHAAPALAELINVKNGTSFLLVLSPACLLLACAFFFIAEKPFLGLRARGYVVAPKSALAS